MRLSKRGWTVWGMAVVALLFALAGKANAAIVTVIESDVVTASYNGTGALSSQSDTSVALNRSNAMTAIDGGSSSTTYLDWSSQSGYTKLDFTFEHTRTGPQYSHAETYDAVLRFTVDQDTTYALSGLYELDSGAGRVYSRTYLYDETFDQYRFYDLSESRFTANEQFILGVAGDGDYDNNTSGNLTGVLHAGHTYRLYFEDYIHAYLNADGGAEASGSLRLEIGQASAATPEPATLAIWAGFGLVGIIGAVRRRFRKMA